MIKIDKNLFKILIFTLIPVTSLFLGFKFNEDLSAGGSVHDFNLTWPIVIKYSNLVFTGANEFTRHMPFHYGLLAILNYIFNEQNFVRLIYLFFSLSLPCLLYLNLSQIYKNNKLNLIIFSFSFLFIPLLRSSAIWANAHYTALIFFLIGNFFYLKSKEKKTYIYKLLNLLFLSFSIYAVQTYLILFLFYLYNYFLSEKFNNFIKIFFFCIFLGLPGLYFIYLNPRISNITITFDIFYTLLTNFSIIFFFFLFLIFNKENLKIIINKIKNLNKIELIIMLFLFIFIFYYQDSIIFDERLRGGGFFYKISFFLLSNKLIFLLSAYLGIITAFILVKYEPKLLYAIIINNLMALNYIVHQKYFEPLFLIIIAVLYKNFLISNVVLNFKNILVFYLLVLIYFSIAYINFAYEFSIKLLL